MIAKLLQLAGGYAAAHTAMQGVQTKIQNAAKRSAIYSISGLIVLAAVGFLVAALWLWLASLYGAIVTSLLIGGGLLFVAILLALTASAIGRAPPVQAPVAPVADVTATLDMMAAELETFLKSDNSGYKAVVAAAVLGFLAARLLRR